MEIMRRTPWLRIREQNSVYKEFLEIVGNGKPTGSVWKETIAVSATTQISVEKVTPSNPSPNSFMQQNERKSSRTRSPRGKSPRVRMSLWPCKDYLKGTCNNSFCERWHPPECLFHKTKSGCKFGKSALMHTVRFINNLEKCPKRMLTRVQWLCWRKEFGKKENLSPMNVTIDLGREVIRNWDKIYLNVNFLMHGNWVAYFRTWSRRSLFSGSALACRKRSSVWSSRRLLRVTPKFENKILRSDIFAQVNLMSVAPTLQNLRIGLRRRQSGKSKVPAKQRGSWKKCVEIEGAWKSTILLTFGKQVLACINS